MKTLFEELKELRTKLEKRPRVRLSTLASIDALLARHRESERWHYPAEGEVPADGVPVLARQSAGYWQYQVVYVKHRDGVPVFKRQHDGWPAPWVTRWRYLSPADVPEAP